MPIDAARGQDRARSSRPVNGYSSVDRSPLGFRFVCNTSSNSLANCTRMHTSDCRAPDTSQRGTLLYRVLNCRCRICRFYSRSKRCQGMGDKTHPPFFPDGKSSPLGSRSTDRLGRTKLCKVRRKFDASRISARMRSRALERPSLRRVPLYSTPVHFSTFPFFFLFPGPFLSLLSIYVTSTRRSFGSFQRFFSLFTSKRFD